MKQTLNHLLSKSLWLTGAVGLFVMAPASAQDETPTLAEQMRECSAISNAIERLVCFDDLVASLPAAQAGTRGQQQAAEAAQRGQETAANAREAARAARETGRSGREASIADREQGVQERLEAAERRAAEAEQRLQQQQAEQRRAAAEAERRNAEAARNQPPSEKTYITIDEAWQSARGLWRFRLDNGQEWHQTSSEGGVRYREGVRYYIEPGSFGSYFLGSDDNNRRMRIRLVD